MKDGVEQILANNRQWAAEKVAADPRFFSRNSTSQSPEFLWIGCSDSRVPASLVTGLPPGEVFVHRNIANVVPDSDTGSAAVIQYAVEALRVKHIIVCGHYGCGGVKAALDGGVQGNLDNWVGNLRQVRDNHAEELAQQADDDARWRRLCELNVVAQAQNIADSAVVQAAWSAGQPLAVHGWIYDLSDGLLKELGVNHSGPAAAN